MILDIEKIRGTQVGVAICNAGIDARCFDVDVNAGEIPVALIDAYRTS